jgi:ribosomal protein S1
LFVELKPGVEALLHNSEMTEGMEKPKVGSTITAKLIKIDLEQRKIGLSLRDVGQPPLAPAPTRVERGESLASGGKVEVGEQKLEVNEQEENKLSPETDHELSMASPQVSLENFTLTESISEN